MLRFDARQWEANEAMIEKGRVLPVGRASKLRQTSASHECILWDWWFWLNVVPDVQCLRTRKNSGWTVSFLEKGLIGSGILE